MSQIELLVGEKQKGETSKAIQACNDFLRMGAGRTLADLQRAYHKKPQNAPTQSLNTIQNWSKRYGWAERAKLHDADLEAEKTAKANEVMQSGVAVAHERVEKLKKLEKLLWEQIHEKGEDGVLHNLWLPDVKQIGSGEFAERVDIERYNSPIISDYRGVLDDLAKETGGRVHKQDVNLSGQDIVLRVAGLDENDV